MEVAGLKEILEDHIRCPDCGSGVNVSFPTVCIASGCKLVCSNGMCQFVPVKRPAAAGVPLKEDSGSALIERITYECAVRVGFHGIW